MSNVQIPQENITLYETLLASNPQIERKGKTTPYTSVNGHMFTFLAKDGTLGLRLSQEDRTLFIEDFKSQLMEQHGRVMKEYVAIPENLLKDTNTLIPFLEKSFNYVSSLKPKAVKKKK